VSLHEADATSLMTMGVPVDQSAANCFSWQDAGMIVAMGCSGGLGVLFLIFAYRRATPSTLAPFEYTGILIAFWLGWVFFDEAPVGVLFPGVLFIVGAGLLIVWRERVNAKNSQRAS
ncbi:MAG: DMT family transporter, partial [Pseudomonadota bacterium]